MSADLQDQLQRARTLRSAVEGEREERKREIDADYDARLRGLEKVIEGFLEALGRGEVGVRPPREFTRLQAAPVVREDGIHTIKDSILFDLKQAQGAGVLRDALTESAIRRGFMRESKRPEDSIRSIVYDMIEKGIPIVRIAPKTWAYRPSADEKQGEGVDMSRGVHMSRGTTYEQRATIYQAGTPRAAVR
jgi:hypothetical protein